MSLPTSQQRQPLFELSDALEGLSVLGGGSIGAIAFVLGAAVLALGAAVLVLGAAVLVLGAAAGPGCARVAGYVRPALVGRPARGKDFPTR